METFIDKTKYKVQKPDIEHIDFENFDTNDLTDDSEDETMKETYYKSFYNKEEQKFVKKAEEFNLKRQKEEHEKNGIKRQPKDEFFVKSYDKYDFAKPQVTKAEKK